MVDRRMAFHISQVLRDFRSGLLKEEDVYNAEETHWDIQLHNNRILSERGYTSVGYAEVLSVD